MDIQRVCREIFGQVSARGWKVSALAVTDRLDHIVMQFTFHCPCGRDIIENLGFAHLTLERVPESYFIEHQVAVIDAELKSHLAEEAA